MIPEILACQPLNILDFGCGTGCYSFFLSRHQTVRVCGVDVDSTRIHESKTILSCLKRKNLSFFSEDRNAPLSCFPTGNFDLALAVEVLQYVYNIQDTLNEICRVLKPDGYLLGHVPTLGYLRPNEKTLFSDKVILHLLAGTGFRNIRLTPTFHGMTRKICHIYEKVSHSKMVVTFLFPWLLLASRCMEIKAAQGDYRFFTAQKARDKNHQGGKVSLVKEQSSALRRGLKVLET
jgi:ubiquinone/menaquinone biosynthesis C-methylase UbiE